MFDSPALVAFLTSVLMYLIAPIVTKLFDKWIGQKKENTDLDSELATASKDIATGSSTLIKDLRDQLNQQKEEIKTLKGKLESAEKETAKRIEETARHREETDAKIEALNRDYAAKAARMDEEIKLLRAQIAEGDKKYKSLKDYTIAVLTALKEKRPLPDPPPELGDSIRGWKWDR